MAEATGEALHDRRLLVVEDDYMIAIDLVLTLETLGAHVAGPAGSVAEALALIEAEGDRIDGASLDVNLGAERAYPIADALIDRNIPFVFATGYDAAVIPTAYAAVPRLEKPYSTAALVRALDTARTRMDERHRAPDPGRVNPVG